MHVLFIRFGAHGQEKIAKNTIYNRSILLTHKPCSRTSSNADSLKINKIIKE